jgi:hypothetical protein
MIHYTYKGLTNLLQKKILSLVSSNIFDKGEKQTYFHLIFKPLSLFSSYILKRFGWDSGLALASVNAYGVFSLCKKFFNRKV